MLLNSTNSNLVRSPDWPRSVEKYTADEGNYGNCWRFALDCLEVPVLQGRTCYSDNTGVVEGIFDALQTEGLSPRYLSDVVEKAPEEMVIIIYTYDYQRWTWLNSEFPTTVHEVHLARVELDGTVVEKPGKDPAQVSSIEEIHDRILSEDGVDARPRFIAIRKPE